MRLLPTMTHMKGNMFFFFCFVLFCLLCFALHCVALHCITLICFALLCFALLCFACWVWFMFCFVLLIKGGYAHFNMYIFHF